MPTQSFIRQQIKANLVAIISLITAISSLSYNTWRNYQNEMNANTRNAAFEVLKNLGELQTVVNYAHFHANSDRGNPIEGWKYVLLVRDLGHLLPHTNQAQTEQLFAVWQADWESMSVNPQSEQAISQQITDVRTEVLDTIKMLN